MLPKSNQIVSQCHKMENFKKNPTVNTQESNHAEAMKLHKKKLQDLIDGLKPDLAWLLEKINSLSPQDQAQKNLVEYYILRIRSYWEQMGNNLKYAEQTMQRS